MENIFPIVKINLVHKTFKFFFVYLVKNSFLCNGYKFFVRQFGQMLPHLALQSPINENLLEIFFLIY